MRATWNQCFPWTLTAAVRETSSAAVHLPAIDGGGETTVHTSGLPLAHLFVDQDSGNGSTWNKRWVSTTGKSKGEREKKYLFLQDLLFLPGNAVATDLQQIERPLASDMSVESRGCMVAKESTFHNLSEKNPIFRGRPSVFTPNFPGASFKGWRGAG